MAPQDLVQVLQCLPPVGRAGVLAGVGEDACVFQLRDDLAVVQTVDLITPVLDDARAFGEVAAANALSDIYAMGGVPLFALNVVAFPARLLPMALLQDMLRGGAAKAAEAGVAVIGGHSLDDPTPKYGMAVTGVIDPSCVVRKSGARPGDRIVLTKPLGVGVLTTALTQGRGGPDLEARVRPVMTQLNRLAAEAMQAVGAHACTDVTGLGLAGHLLEMAEQSQVALRVSLGRIPVLPEAWALVRDGAMSQGTLNNALWFRDRVRWAPGVSPEAQIILCDAQTSGGLLITGPPEQMAVLCGSLTAAGVAAAEIGEVRPGPGGAVEVAP